MRILITGSRDWDDREMIESVLRRVSAKWGVVTLVSGACPTGADRMCEEYAEKRGWVVERHPADWATHGKRAGFVRNSEIVQLGADHAFAFIKNESKGATMTASLCAKARIPLDVFRN